MGGWISSIRATAPEDRKQFRNHEQNMDERKDDALNEGILSGNLRRDIKWYHWVLYDMRFRILYSTILTVVVGIGVPLLIFFLSFEKSNYPKYGSCLINANYRFECLINGVSPPSEDECIEAMCCYDSNNSLPYKCHHSFTPAYQYEVTDVEKMENSNNPLNPIVELGINPKYQAKTDRGILKSLNVRMEWIDETHFSLGFNSDGSASTTTTISNKKRRRTDSIEENENPQFAFEVTYAAESEYFFVHLQRSLTKETIFDTRLGPIISDSRSLSFTTVLPSPYFFGLKGGQGGGTIKYDVINAPGNMEFPFYLSLEKNGTAHGLLVETTSPFVFQFIEAPAVLFHFQQFRTTPSATMHFFLGPTPADIYKQLSAYLESASLRKRSWMPPYWSLGLHLCRRGFNITEADEEMRKLQGESTQQLIPYDSDCIDENLRTPFLLDETQYGDAGEFANILDNLKESNRRILLSQRMGLDVSAYNDVARTPLIMANHSSPLVGILKKGAESHQSVYYLDYLNSGSHEWVKDEMLSLVTASSLNSSLSGLVIVDNFPLSENSSQICKTLSPPSATRLSTSFTSHGLICHDSIHTNTSSSTSIPHFDTHNVYGFQSTRTLSQVLESVIQSSNERLIVASSSSFQEVFTGLQVAFTWDGLKESLSNTVRNFMMTPFPGTPICGNFPSQIEDRDELCLRWFQLGLLLPFARNTHETGEVMGPLDLRLNRNYVISSIRNRYRLNPYYYTHFYESIQEAAPIIRPLFYDFHESDWEGTRGDLTQFMIGPALMAAPILSGASSREAYFPKGTWYDMHGSLVVSSETSGRTLTIPSILAEIPVFIRSGYIIPTMSDPAQSSCEETRNGAYRIISTFPANAHSDSMGSLYVDDGISKNSVLDRKFDHVTFKGTTKYFQLKAECNLGENPAISRTISEILIIGFPKPAEVLQIHSEPDIESLEKPYADEDNKSLRIRLDLNWCKISEVKLTWD